MGIRKPEQITSFEQLNNYLLHFYENLSISDLKAGDLREEAPTVDKLDKTRYTIAEVGGVPSIYYKTKEGNLYKWDGTAA